MVLGFMTTLPVGFGTLFPCYITQGFWGVPISSLSGTLDGIGWMFALVISEVPYLVNCNCD